MTTVVDQLVSAWTVPGFDEPFDAVRRSSDVSARHVWLALTATFSIEQIVAEVEQYLFGVVEAYDNGELPYSAGSLDGLGVRSRAILCTALVGETVELKVSRYLLSEIVRSFPALESYQTIRTLIETRLTKADVLAALSAALESRRRAQMISAAIGLVFYAGFGQGAEESNAVNHAIFRIKRRLDRLISDPRLSESRKLVLKGGKQHLDKWR